MSLLAILSIIVAVALMFVLAVLIIRRRSMDVIVYPNDAWCFRYNRYHKTYWKSAGPYKVLPNGSQERRIFLYGPKPPEELE